MTLFQLFDRRDPAVTEPCGSALAARDRLRLLFAQERATAPKAFKTAEISLEALSCAQAACIQAIRSGKVTRTPIAVAAGLSLRGAANMLDALCERGLIRRVSGGRAWALTERGLNHPMQQESLAATDGGSHTAVRIGAMGRRLLELLDRPRCGPDIARELSITPSRVRALVVALMAIGKVRVGDPDRVSLVVARPDDPSVLLTYREARVLSSFPLQETTPGLVAAHCRMPLSTVMPHVSVLSDHRLVRESGQSGRGTHYQLTEHGSAHPQYRLGSKKARSVA
jgi:DNA-binding IclR family transcriptional regulator